MGRRNASRELAAADKTTAAAGGQVAPVEPRRRRTENKSAARRGAMITAEDLRAKLTWTVAGLSVLDIAAAVILSAYAVALTSGVVHTSHPHGGVAASIRVLAMTLPVAWCRRWPLAAAGVLAAAAVLNGVLFGPMVRCGAALPRSSSSHSRLASGATGPGRPLDCCSAPAPWPPRAFTIRRSKHEGSSSCSRCSSPSSPPGGWSAPGRNREGAASQVRGATAAGADGAAGGPGRPRPGNRGT